MLISEINLRNVIRQLLKEARIQKIDNTSYSIDMDTGAFIPDDYEKNSREKTGDFYKYKVDWKNSTPAAVKINIIEKQGKPSNLSFKLHKGNLNDEGLIGLSNAIATYSFDKDSGEFNLDEEHGLPGEHREGVGELLKSASRDYQAGVGKAKKSREEEEAAKKARKENQMRSVPFGYVDVRLTSMAAGDTSHQKVIPVTGKPQLDEKIKNAYDSTDVFSLLSIPGSLVKKKTNDPFSGRIDKEDHLTQGNKADAKLSVDAVLSRMKEVNDDSPDTTYNLALEKDDWNVYLLDDVKGKTTTTGNAQVLSGLYLDGPGFNNLYIGNRNSWAVMKFPNGEQYFVPKVIGRGVQRQIGKWTDTQKADDEEEKSPADKNV